MLNPSVLFPSSLTNPLQLAEPIDSLLAELWKSRWSRLSSEYDDPLGMLFSNRVRQWTAGWHQGNLYLLVWEAHSWQTQPGWQLYENGERILNEEDGLHKSRSALLHKLLESDQLPFARYEDFFDPLIDYRFSQPQRETTAKALMTTILARPEIFDHLKEALFQTLEAELGEPEWPMLEVMKLHRLQRKTPLVWLFQQFVQTGFIRTLRDNSRLDRALTLLQEDWFQFGYKTAPLFRPAYDTAYDAFRAIITDGSWRARLRFKLPQH